MSIVLSCECGRKLQISEEYAGQEGQCPSCGRTMLIPSVEDAEAITAPVENVAAAAYELRPTDVAAGNGVPESQSNDGKLTNHGGGPLPADSDFFVDPPREIGPVISAHSTLTARNRPWSAGGRLILAGSAGLVGLCASATLVLLASPRGEFWQVLWPTVGSLTGVLVGYTATRFRHFCSYVGRDGVARFTCSGSRERSAEGVVFVFCDASELRTSQTVRYVNGVYQGTDYAFTWTDAAGRPRYVFSGTYRNAKGMPPTPDPHHFGRAAETAWTNYLLTRVQQQMEAAGSVAFNLKDGHSIRVARRGLIMQLGGEPVEWAREEIEAVAVDKGAVKIKRADAREGWFSATGVVKFPFDSLANAKLFFHVVDKLLNVRVG